MAKQQVSVLLERELIDFVEQPAERKDRSIAGQIRHIVAEAARDARDPGNATSAGQGTRPAQVHAHSVRGWASGAADADAALEGRGRMINLVSPSR